MSFLKELADKAKDVLLEEEPEPGKPPEQPKVVQAAPVTRPPLVTSTARTPAYVPVSADPELVETLLQKCKGSLPAAYIRFGDMKAKLKSAIADERQRVQAAFAAADVGAEVIVSALEQALRNLEIERSNFQTAVDQKRNRDVGTRQGQISQLQASNSTNQAKIEELQQQIADMRAACTQNLAKISEIESEIAATEREVSDKVEKFNASLEAARANITAEQSSISSLVKT